jgi:nucleotide-binding universal stress UspA family protein
VFKHLLCPIDGSEQSLEALDMAARFAAEQQARLTIFMAVDPSKAAAMAFGDPVMTGACLDALEGDAKSLVRDAVARVQTTIDPQTAVDSGQPIEAIVQYASTHGCDIIVMGSHGRSGIQRALLGSVAEGVVRHANVPVLIDRSAANTATVR